MVVEERSPGLRGWTSTTARHVTSDGGLGDGKSQFQQLTMDSRRAPTQVGASHFANEATQRSVLSWASERRTRFPPPEDTKAVPMPADDSLGFDDEEGTAPVGLGRAQDQKALSTAEIGG